MTPLTRLPQNPNRHQSNTDADGGRRHAAEWHRRLVLEYRAFGDDELRAELESLAAQRTDLADEYAASEAADVMWSVRESTAVAEWNRREARRVARSLTSNSASRVDWPALARSIREQHGGLVELLDGNATALRRVGRSGRRGDEYAGPCPACGGEDRFIVWPEPPGRFWCRRCGVSGSVIDAYILANPSSSFFDACRALAGELGLPLPAAIPARRAPVYEEVVV